MKRWKPIKTEKKQLGGIIKFLEKISPKLASITKGRLIVPHFRPIKSFNPPKEMRAFKEQVTRLTPQQIGS